MSNYGELLLSKVIDNNDPNALKRFGIDSTHLIGADRKAYEYITDYAEKNRGEAPSYATITAEVDGFNWTPHVSDSYEWLTQQIKASAAKRQLADYLQGDFSSEFTSERDGNKLLEVLTDKLESIKLGTSVRNSVGTDVKKAGEKYLEEYRKRKAGESFKIWRSKFSSVNEGIGGYFSGNIYTWYGRPGRGKSVITLEEAIESAFQGANVLIWAMEMSEFEVMTRIYSSVSGREGITTATINGVDYEAGFESRALLMGKLDEQFEKGFETFLSYIDELIPGNIIVRATDDESFYNRGVKQLEADIIETKADVVVLDAIYHMDYEANTSKTAGGDVAATSLKIRRLAGRTKTVIHIITQAEEVKDDTDEEGNREIRVPKRAEIKKTKAVLEDAVNTFGIDTVDGLGVIELGKGRNGGEGTRVEILYLPNYGIVKEMPSGEVAAQQFTEVF